MEIERAEVAPSVERRLSIDDENSDEFEVINEYIEEEAEAVELEEDKSENLFIEGEDQKIQSGEGEDDSVQEIAKPELHRSIPEAWRIIKEDDKAIESEVQSLEEREEKEKKKLDEQKNKQLFELLEEKEKTLRKEADRHQKEISELTEKMDNLRMENELLKSQNTTNNEARDSLLARILEMEENVEIQNKKIQEQEKETEKRSFESLQHLQRQLDDEKISEERLRCKLVEKEDEILMLRESFQQESASVSTIDGLRLKLDNCQRELIDKIHALDDSTSQLQRQTTRVEELEEVRVGLIDRLTKIHAENENLKKVAEVLQEQAAEDQDLIAGLRSDRQRLTEAFEGQTQASSSASSDSTRSESTVTASAPTTHHTCCFCYQPIGNDNYEAHMRDCYSSYIGYTE